MARLLFSIACVRRHLQKCMKGLPPEKPYIHGQARCTIKYVTFSSDVSRRYLCNVRTFCKGVHGCWNCGLQTNTDLLCKRCNVLQKPDTKRNYFELFNIMPTYEVQLSELSTQYRKMQNVLHPDRFVNSSEEERAYSAEYSSLVNKAYSTLSHPLSRGLYMLELNGIYLEEGNVQSDPEFLMDLMEKNEEVDQAKDLSEIATLDAKNKAMLNEISRNIADHFREGDLKKVKEALIKMKYYARIDAKIKNLKQTKFLE